MSKKSEKIIEQCKQELINHYIQADVFKYKIEWDEFVCHVLVTKNKKLFYEFDNIFYDKETFEFIQWGLQIHDGRF